MAEPTPIRRDATERTMTAEDKERIIAEVKLGFANGLTDEQILQAVAVKFVEYPISAHSGAKYLLTMLRREAEADAARKEWQAKVEAQERERFLKASTDNLALLELLQERLPALLEDMRKAAEIVREGST